jgi:hypothetical protein
MRRYYLAFTVLFLPPCPAVAVVQLASERAEALERVCNYNTPPITSGVATGSGNSREYRVGLGQNCPSTYPSTASVLPPPPTARFMSEEIAGQIRTCVYGQTGTTWTRAINVSQPCPPWAGMTPATDPQPIRH